MTDTRDLNPVTHPASLMLDNAATASQNRSILDEPVTRGAILRSVHQFIEHNWACTSADLMAILKEDPDFES